MKLCWKILEIQCMCFQDGISLGNGFVWTDHEVMSARLATWREFCEKKEDKFEANCFPCSICRPALIPVQAPARIFSCPVNVVQTSEDEKLVMCSSDQALKCGHLLCILSPITTRPSKKPQFPLKRLLGIVVIKYLGFIGFPSCWRLPWGKFSKGMDEPTADCDRLRGNKVQKKFKPGGLWGSDLAFPLTHRSLESKEQTSSAQS